MRRARLIGWVATGLATAAVVAGCDGGPAPRDPHAGHGTAATPAAGEAHPERVPVLLGADFAQRIGVRTTPAVRKPLTRSIRTVGVVRTDETREAHVHVKWDGWIDALHASFVGQTVRKGDPLFTVYSPDLVASQQEFLDARRRELALPASTDAAAASRAARERLRLWDVPEDEIAEIERSGQVKRAIMVRSPRDGTILEKKALAGMYVETAMELYAIADLSKVWVLADLYEFEAPLVAPGAKARFEPVGLPGRSLDAVVTFVQPVVDEMTRTVKVRLEADNADGALRPGAYGTVRIDVATPESVMVPLDAVLDTGKRQVVFVRTPDGAYAPRDVRLGASAAPEVQVLEGVAEGEEVVTRAQFLLDSESRLRAASGRGPGHGGH